MYLGHTIRLPIAVQGFSGSRNPSQMQPGHLSHVEGLSLEGGVISKQGGAQKLNANSLTAAVIAGINWSPTSGSRRDVVFLADGDVLRDDDSGTFATLLATGLTPVRSPPAVFVPGGGESVGDERHLFLFSGTNQVQEVTADAATMQAISGPAADWAAAFPTFGVLHAFRLWAGGNSSDPHRIYASTLADHEDFVGAGAQSFAVFPGEGEMLVGGVSFRGLLILWKYPRGIYVINTIDPDPSNWQVDRLSDAVGGLNQSSIVPVENDVLYADQIGNIHSLSATHQFGDVNTSNISRVSDIATFVRSNINLSNIRRMVGTWYASKDQAWFSMPTISQDDNDLIMALDFNRPDLGPRFLLSRRDIAISLWTRPDSVGTLKPAVGDGLGFVWNLDHDTKSKDGDAYALEISTANTDLGFADPMLATKMKSGEFLELVSEPRGNWNMTVSVFWDDVLAETVQFSMGVGGAALGDFELDLDTLSSDVVSSDRQRITGSGRRVRLDMQNDGLNEDVAIADVYLSFSVMDEKASHGQR